MGQTMSQDEDNGNSLPVVQVGDGAASRDNSKINEPNGTGSSKRKRKSSMNARDQTRTLWTPSSPEQEEHNLRQPKRKRVSNVNHKRKDLDKADEEHSRTNNVLGVMVDLHPSEDPENPIISPKQVKGPTEQSRQKKIAKSTSAPQLKSAKPKKPTRQSTAPDTPRKVSAKETNRKAHQEPKAEGKNKLTGFFTSAEVKALESFKLEFCNEHGLSGETFDLMVQHSARDVRSEFPCHSSIITKPDFWQTIYEILPNRDRRSKYRFMRRHFQASTQKPHNWTDEQDEELVSLHAKHGPKFAYIAKLIGRSDDDVVQRWKNRLQYRDKMRWGPWSYEEVRGLLDAVQAAYDSMAKAGKNVGKDLYEMDESLIGWGVVSDKIQNWRSRKQCSDKWRQIRHNVLTQRASGNPDAIFEVNRYRYPPMDKNRSPPANVQYKSSEYVDSEDEGEENDDKIESQPASLQGSASKGGKAVDPALQSTKPATSAEMTNAKSASAGESESESAQAESDVESESHVSDSADAQSEDETACPESNKLESRKETGGEANVENSTHANGATPKQKVGTAQEKLNAILKEYYEPSEPASKEKPKGGPLSGERSNGLASPFMFQKRDTTSQGRKLSPTLSSDSDSESSESSESDSSAPQPSTDVTKLKADREDSVNSDSQEGENSSHDSSSDNDESSSDESESDEEEQLKPSSPEPPSTSTKRKSPPAPAEGDKQLTLKRLKAELAKSNNKPAEPSPLNKPESESESSSDSESNSSEDGESSSDSDSDADSDSGSSESESEKPQSSSKTQRVSAGNVAPNSLGTHAIISPLARGASASSRSSSSSSTDSDSNSSSASTSSRASKRGEQSLRNGNSADVKQEGSDDSDSDSDSDSSRDSKRREQSLQNGNLTSVKLEGGDDSSDSSDESNSDDDE